MRPIFVDPAILDFYIDETFTKIEIDFPVTRRPIMEWLENHAPASVMTVAQINISVSPPPSGFYILGGQKQVLRIYFPQEMQAVLFKLQFM